MNSTKQSKKDSDTMFSSRTQLFKSLLIATSLLLSLVSSSSIETDCVSDEFIAEATSPSDEAGEVVNAGERDFSVHLIKSLFKVIFDTKYKAFQVN